MAKNLTVVLRDVQTAIDAAAELDQIRVSIDPDDWDENEAPYVALSITAEDDFHPNEPDLLVEAYLNTSQVKVLLAVLSEAVRKMEQAEQEIAADTEAPPI